MFFQIVPRHLLLWKTLFGFQRVNNKKPTHLDWNNSDRDLAIIVPGDNSNLKSLISSWKIGNLFNKVVAHEYKLV